ncbi:hypothetical protein [Promicromonospora iranensis]|uniref:DUF5666 domain-containing protein n=1 Tax=Promicromonospora iranensis TaxID=1105144 RepID=A0ABU2CHI3_9MICO|nr:hypothetical protein [Promicromonospora iranensis]MDR7380791.1 hypothetical protein [Promicromonospora iranensis]
MKSLRKRALAAPIALVAALTLTACNDSAGPEQGTSVDDVEDADPDQNDMVGPDVVGRTVTVSGEIDAVAADSAFWLGGNDWFDEGAPVVSATGDFTEFDIQDPEGLAEDDTVVQVTGPVEEFVLTDFEEEHGIDLDDDALEQLEGEAVIVAEDVSTLAGENITISGEVSDVLSTVAFRLAGTGWDVIVLDAEQAAVEAGNTVQVTGTVRQMNVAEFEEDYSLDLDDGRYEDYEGRLVLVAETVEPIEPVE